MVQRHKKMGQPKDAMAMLKADHQRVWDLFQQLRDIGPYSRGFNAKFKELLQNVKHHVEEETEMFPLAEEKLEEDMKDLQNEMQELKAQNLAS